MFKVVFKHILPNLLGKVVVQCSITFALTVVIEASSPTSAWGPSPHPELGADAQGRPRLPGAGPWMALYPGIALALTVLCFNILGDALSERLNPKL